MSAPPWMPFYVGDYIADTGHLSTVEHGAYFLLIMHYWQHSGLPSDSAKLARICRMSPGDWADIEPTLADLFGEGWTHKRIDAELSIAADTIAKRSAAGKAGASARYNSRKANASQSHANATANAKQAHAPPPSPLPNTSRSGSDEPSREARSNPEVELFERGKAVLGKSAGGLVRQLLRAKDDNVALARAAVEQASTKQSPREYIGRIIQGTGPPGEAIQKVAL